MRKEHLQYLACPDCKAELSLAIEEEQEGRVKTGELSCAACKLRFPVIGFIPRFVKEGHYADSFGFQWFRHAKTQLDSVIGLPISKQRFFKVTRWGEDLTGEVILEVGCGAGRFTEVIAATGAMVVSFDASRGVEVNYESNGWRDNLMLVQAELERMPFPPAFFDRAVSLGVLQHTADPHRSFLAIAFLVKKGGSFAVDVYKKSLARRLLSAKYWVRPLTARMNPTVLYTLTRAWVSFWWQPTSIIARFPQGRRINRFLFFIADYRGYLPLPAAQLKEWAVLDNFDMLSPRYDNPTTAFEVRGWFEEAGFQDVDADDEDNIVEGRGVRSALSGKAR
ncbi:methyltransferase domain-containing protein [Patescibacteria group bacterium]|nr:methyltransferase domain-containing protein [Patescibacteria group bacterium]